MINAIEIFDDVAKDNVNTNENGTLGIDRFNRMSKRAELRMIDWLSGDVANEQPPAPYLSQKNKDWLQHLITPHSAHAQDGKITIPSDYYQYENMFRIGSKVESDCESEEAEEIDQCDTPIDLLDGQQFNRRCKTHIKSKQPSIVKPIAKMINGKIEFRPKDVGSVTLEYIRLPKFGLVGKKTDTVYNTEVPDVTTTQNYEWPEGLREVLIWFITDTFALHTREQALKQANNDTKKTVRG